MCRRLLGCALLAASAGACARPADRYDFSGTVSFRGRPVPAGVIAVNPDLKRGNDGPQGFAEIRDGRFDTRSLAKGVPAGPVVVVIDGFDGKATPDSPYGNLLFAGYKASVELPRESSTRDFDVPASAAVDPKKAAVAAP